MYKWVSGSTYDLYVKFYRACSGAPAPATLTVCYNNTCDRFQDTIVLAKLSGNLPPSTTCGPGTVIPFSCPNQLTTCQSPTATVPGYEEYWYSARVTLPSQCDFWRFSTSIATRNPAITNLANPSTTALYLEATLYSAAGTGENPGNSSPCFTIKPILYTYNATPVVYNPGAIDADGDSLTYEMLLPRDQGIGCYGVNVAFSTPQFNLTNNPFATGNTFSLNAATGQITFTSSQSQTANIALLVKQYQNGVLRGTSMREMQIIALPGTNAPPQVFPPTTVSGGQLTNGRYEGCAGQPLQFCFKVLAADTAARLAARDNHNNPPPGTTSVTPGASLVYNNLFNDSLNVCFDWTPTNNDTGLHNLVITISDTTCHFPGYPVNTTFALPIYILPAPEAGSIAVISQSTTFIFQVNGSAHASSYFWDFGDGTTDTALTPIHTYTTDGVFPVTFHANNFCGTDTAMVVIVHALSTTEAAFTTHSIQLFPSPATHSITIQNTASQAMKTIRILDITGSLVREVKATGTKVQEVDISALVSGIYLVRVELADGTVATRRLQVRR